MKLLEKKEDYVTCLQLLVDGMKQNEYSQNREAVERTFDWIHNILILLEARKTDANPESTGKEDSFRRQIMINFRGLIRLDPHLTVELIDDMFANEQEKFVESINGHIEEQFMYLDYLLSVQHDKIQSCIESYLMSGTDKEKALTFMKLQSLHLRLMCQNFPKQVLDRVKRIKKNEIKFKLDECLEICEEYK